MITKIYKNISEKSYFGQDIDSWANRFKDEDIEKTALSGSSDYISSYLKRYLPKNSPILEGGCGIGKYVIAFRNLGYDMRGVDFSSELVKRMKEYDSELSVEVADIKRLPFPNEYFGCYLSAGVLEHFEYDIFLPIYEARRVLKRNGLFLITIPFVNVIRRFIKYRKKEVFSEYYFSKKSISEILKVSGFKVEKIYPINFLWGELGGFFRIFKDRIKSRVIYDLAIKENRDNPLFNIILSILNEISGNMLFIVAKKI